MLEVDVIRFTIKLLYVVIWVVINICVGNDYVNVVLWVFSFCCFKYGFLLVLVVDIDFDEDIDIFVMFFV